MSWIADAGLWIAIVLAGLLTGVLATRWNDPRSGDSPLAPGLMLASAAAAVVAWCASAGALLGAAQGDLLAAFVPIEVKAGFRLAVLWATLPGGALTFGTLLLVRSALTGVSRGGARPACITSAAAVMALGLAAWFTPETGAIAQAVPPFVQSPWAALAPFFALVALLILTTTVVSVLAGGVLRGELLIVAWVASTAAVVCEQAARSQLGIGPRDALVLGSASSGLVLWLLASALLHRRVQALALRVKLPPAAPSHGRGRLASLTAHTGALLLAASFALHAFATRSTVSLPPGTAVDVTDAFRRSWQLVNQGVSRFDAEGVDVTAVAIEARDPRGVTTLLTPEIREYHARDGQHLETAVVLRRTTGGPVQAMRLLLSEPDSFDVASVRVTFLPAPILWPVGAVLLVISAVLALSASPTMSQSIPE